MSSRDLAIVQPPEGRRGFYRFTLRRNGSKAWPVLQWRHKDQRLTLRMPKTATLQDSLAAFDLRVPWYQAFAARRRPPKAIKTLTLHGQVLDIVHSPGFADKPRVNGAALEVKSAPLETMQWAVGQFLWDETLKIITPLVQAKAAILGKEAGQIWLSNAQRKWGACDHQNNVNFSWRLAMAPPFVQEYLAAHEVAHFNHRHHGDSFWEEVSTLMADWAEADHWLTFNGGAVMAFRFEHVMPQAADTAPQS